MTHPSHSHTTFTCGFAQMVYNDCAKTGARAVPHPVQQCAYASYATMSKWHWHHQTMFFTTNKDKRGH
jgi:hypothetical protein